MNQNPAQFGKETAGRGDLAGYAGVQLPKMRQLRPMRVASNPPHITMD
jgi:hypothetical protein